MASFQHSPIDLEGSAFRLLRLARGERDDPIECHLFNAILFDSEGGFPYEALSYTWGKIQEQCQIVVNGQLMRIRWNLYNTLRHLRHQHTDRILWVDAICIDQANLDERVHQIRHMKGIYEQAERVLVWLGEANQETDFAMDMMIELQEHLTMVQGSWRNTLRAWTDFDQHMSGHAGGLPPEIIAARRAGMAQLLRRSWFTRVWVLQEIASARVASIVCGSKSVSARIFALVPPILHIEPDSHTQAVLDIMPGLSKEESWWCESRDLRTLLVKFKESEAEDPRDKIFALFNISSDLHCPNFPGVDYRKRESEVLGDVLSYLLPLEPSLADVATRNSVQEFFKNIYCLDNYTLLQAIRSGDDNECSLLLNSKKDSIDLRRLCVRVSVMPLAVKQGCISVVEAMLDSGISKDLERAFLIAIAIGHDLIVRALLKFSTQWTGWLGGGSFKSKKLLHHLGWTPMILAAAGRYKQVLMTLLQNELFGHVCSPKIEEGMDYWSRSEAERLLEFSDDYLCLLAISSMLSSTLLPPRCQDSSDVADIILKFIQVSSGEQSDEAHQDNPIYEAIDSQLKFSSGLHQFVQNTSQHCHCMKWNSIASYSQKRADAVQTYKETLLEKELNGLGRVTSKREQIPIEYVYIFDSNDWREFWWSNGSMLVKSFNISEPNSIMHETVLNLISKYHGNHDSMGLGDQDTRNDLMQWNIFSATSSEENPILEQQQQIRADQEQSALQHLQARRNEWEQNAMQYMQEQIKQCERKVWTEERKNWEENAQDHFQLIAGEWKETASGRWQQMRALLRKRELDVWLKRRIECWELEWKQWIQQREVRERDEWERWRKDRESLELPESNILHASLRVSQTAEDLSNNAL